MTGRGLIATVIAVVCFVLFNANGREIGSYDSQAAKFLAVEMARHHRLSLGHVVGRTPGLAERPGFTQDLSGNYRIAYPLPSAMMAAGVASVLSLVRVVDLDAPLAPAVVAKVTASLLSALAVAFAFFAAASRTSTIRAAIVALAFGLGTNVWASVSQTLWQQETALFAMMAAVVLLASDTGRTARYLGAGALLGLAGWARPQLAPAVLVIAASVPMRWGLRAAIAWIPLAAVGAMALSINVAWFGHLLGAVPRMEALHPSVHGVSGSLGANPLMAAAGLLFSPSRGLLVFSPVVAFALAGVGAVRRAGWGRDLPWCASAAVAQYAAYSAYSVWWGGHTFGPRYMLDVLPLLVPIAAAGMDAIMARTWLRVAGGAALIWSIAVAGLGAFVYPNEQWNSVPVEVDRHHDRLWDWRDSQILRAAHAPASPQNFSLLTRDAFRTPASSSR